MAKKNKKKSGNNIENDTKVKVEFSEEQIQEKPDVEQEEIKEPEMTIEEQLKLKVEELEDKLLRTSADFENYKKRLMKRSEEQVEYATDRKIIDLLEVVDNFERAMDHGNNKSDVQSLQKGMELIYNQLISLLEKYNVKKIDAVGETFNPDFHEALMQVNSEEFPEGTIAIEINKGYMKDERVLRHSKVGVSNGEIKQPSEKKE